MIYSPTLTLPIGREGWGEGNHAFITHFSYSEIEIKTSVQKSTK